MKDDKTQLLVKNITSVISQEYCTSNSFLTRILPKTPEKKASITAIVSGNIWSWLRMEHRKNCATWTRYSEEVYRQARWYAPYIEKHLGLAKWCRCPSKSRCYPYIRFKVSFFLHIDSAIQAAFFVFSLGTYFLCNAIVVCMFQGWLSLYVKGIFEAL